MVSPGSTRYVPPTSRASTRPFTDLEREIVRQIAGLRAIAGLDQDQMGMPRGTYGAIERCDRHADMSQLGRIVAAIVATGRTDLRGMSDLIARAEAAIQYRQDAGLSLP